MRKCEYCGQYDSGTVYPCKITAGHLWSDEIENPVGFYLKNLTTHNALFEAYKAEALAARAHLDLIEAYNSNAEAEIAYDAARKATEEMEKV